MPLASASVMTDTVVMTQTALTLTCNGLTLTEYADGVITVDVPAGIDAATERSTLDRLARSIGSSVAYYLRATAADGGKLLQAVEC